MAHEADQHKCRGRTRRRIADRGPRSRSNRTSRDWARRRGALKSHRIARGEAKERWNKLAITTSAARTSETFLIRGITSAH